MKLSIVQLAACIVAASIGGLVYAEALAIHPAIAFGAGVFAALLVYTAGPRLVNGKGE